jgi:small basic protein (TIGR04137 family)
MSIDRSLKTAGSLSRHRNVLTRAERLSKLKNEERWKDGSSVFGLPKVGNRTAKVGKKAKKKEEEATAAAPGAAAPAAPAAGGKAPAAAAAKPAAGAKAAGKEAKK